MESPESYSSLFPRTMKNVIKIILLCSLAFPVCSQSKSEKLKKEQHKLEKKIANTKSLLRKVSSNKEESLNELQLIENQIKSREALLRVYDNQVKMADIYIQEKESELKALRLRIEKLKKQYKEMILYAYKNRNKNGQMMYVLSADSYYDSQKRNKYLKSVSSLHKKQLALIKQDQIKINQEIERIEIEKSRKKETLIQKRIEREEIETDRQKKLEIFTSIQNREDVLIADIRKNESKKREVKKRINTEIKREIEEIEKKRREAERKKREAAINNGETTDNSAVDFMDESSEGKIVSKKFENNRGTLPWPVEKGSIVERYGRNQHPSLKGVYTNNNGIDISCPLNAPIRAIFNGEISSVFTISGSGKVVIVKHGNYRTVYSNLKETAVSKGDKVATKQRIGTVIGESSSLGRLHFEIHKVSGTSTKSLNPVLWIYR